MDGSSFLASFKAAAASSSKDMIQFSGSIDSFPIRGDEVVVIPSSGDHDMGSSKLQISNIVNFGWEFQYSYGQLVAVHKSGTYFAYAIVSPGKNTGMVRVVQKKTDQRALVKGMKGKIKDLAFAHCLDQIILGVVDEFGNLFIFRIEQTNEEDSDNDKPLLTEMLLQVMASQKDSNLDEHRLLWCPYLPENPDDDVTSTSTDNSSARLLVLTHGHVTEVWNIDMVLREHSVGAVINSETVTNGKLVVCDHSDAIRDASFSPDGAALATASADGQVKFFQVYMHGAENPRCLHQWKPHEGQPVSSLFFLDNHKDHQPDEQFWKYALTGSCQNTELKLWSCENWTCLQTVQIKHTPSGMQDGKPMALEAVLDLSAQYLLLSDIHRKIVYVLQLEIKDDRARFVSVSEFATPSPFLSMAMLEAGVRRVADKHTLGEDDDSDDDSEDEEIDQTTSREATVISFLLVQPKSLQECRIVYDDAFSQPQIAAMETISAMEHVMQHVKPEPTTPDPIEELAEAADKITLMSPEVFGAAKSNAPQIKEEPATPVDVSPPKRGAAIALAAMASGGSSPSRGVQDILGDTEEQGGLGAEIVITEEPDEEEDIDDIDDSDEDSDELSKMLDKANAKIKQEQMQQQHTQQQDPLSLKLKEESNPQPWSVVKTEPEIKKEPNWTVKTQQEIMLKQEIKPEPNWKPSASPILASAPMVAQSSTAELQMVMARLADMTALIQTQRSEVQVWREEMRALRREDIGNFKSVLDNSTSEATGEMKKTTQVILNSVKTNVKNNICEEVRKATPMLVQAANVSLQEALNKEVHSKVLKSDLQLKEALQKLVTSKAVTENIANSIAASLTPALHAAFKDALNSAIVPAFEKSLQNLFAQLSTAFNKGLKEYEGLLKTHVNKQIEPVVKDFKDIVNKNKVHNDLEKRLANIIRNEIKNIQISATPAGGVSAGSTPASPATPNPTLSLAEIQANIGTLLSEGKFNDAFLVALNANNLTVVVGTCEMVNIQILNQVPCPLSQEVLLSLIQQLGRNLESNTDTKVNFLTEAVTTLDPEYQPTQRHIPTVMASVRNQLTNYLHNNPRDRRVKTLALLTQGFNVPAS